VAIIGKKTVTQLDTSFTRCPNGHELPNAEDGIDCTSALCALNVEKPPIPVGGKMLTEQGEAEMEARRLRQRHTLTKKLVPTPEGLEGADAETYVEKKLVSLSVPAVAVLEKQLLYGTDEEQRKAARDILDATGHGKKERAGNGASLIIVNMGGGSNGPTIDLPPMLRTPALASGK
jgi:hypothetical protein